MLRLTEKLKGWLVEHAGVDETAGNDVFNEAAVKAVGEGTLAPSELVKLTSEDNPVEEPDLAKTIAGAIFESLGPLAKRVEDLASEMESAKKEKAEPGLKEQIEALTKAIADKPGRNELKPLKDGETPQKLFSQQLERDDKEETPNVDVIPIDKMYSSTRSALYHKEGTPLAGERVVFGKDHSPLPLPGGVSPMAPMYLDTPSELDLAICGAYFKWAAHAGNATGRGLPRWLRMTDHDKAILDYSMRKGRWTGIVGRGRSDTVDEYAGSPNVVANAKLTDRQRKALIDDSISGGLEAAPIEFDAAAITTPVLHGELFPLVSVVPITRGRQIEGFAISNPTISSGPAEGTEITVFTTDSMVSAFDTTIYNATGAIEIGNDFEEDSPVNMGQLVVQLYGEKFKEWLDNQIANGDGTTEPKGVFNATGITDIGNPAGGANAAPQAEDYLTLAFNVAKQYRPPSDANRCVYIANDTSYRRARSISVGAADERKVFGMDVASYRMYEWPYKVQNDIANTVAGFFCMKYYRMYRRLGLNVRVETGGKELARKNLTLITVRARYGGQLELGGAGAYSDNWQT